MTDTFSERVTVIKKRRKGKKKAQCAGAGLYPLITAKPFVIVSPVLLTWIGYIKGPRSCSSQRQHLLSFLPTPPTWWQPGYLTGQWALYGGLESTTTANVLGFCTTEKLFFCHYLPLFGPSLMSILSIVFSTRLLKDGHLWRPPLPSLPSVFCPSSFVGS